MHVYIYGICAYMHWTINISLLISMGTLSDTRSVSESWRQRGHKTAEKEQTNPDVPDSWCQKNC